MTIDFFDLPQGSPSVTPVSSATGYCTASDVASLNKSRAAAWGVGHNPNINDVNGYIIMVAGQIDATLITRGISIPVNTASYPEAEGLLCWVNSQGAAWMVEEASPNSPNIDRVKAAFDAAMKMLAEAELSLDVPSEQARAEVRAPWLTFSPPEGTYDPTLDVIGGHSGDGISAGGQNRRSLPFFSRGMRF